MFKFHKKLLFLHVIICLIMHGHLILCRLFHGGYKFQGIRLIKIETLKSDWKKNQKTSPSFVTIEQHSYKDIPSFPQKMTAFAMT